MLSRDMLLAGAGLRSMTSASGRRLYRHSSNQATCIEFDYWGKKKILIVPDSKYRRITAFGLNGVDADTVLGAYAPLQCNIAPGAPAATASLPALTDSALQSTLSEAQKHATGKEKTGAILSACGAAATACSYCRTLSVSGFTSGSFEMPNTYEGAVIFAESENIDGMDPTLTAKSNLNLGTTGLNGRFNGSLGALICTAWGQGYHSQIAMISGSGYIGQAGRTVSTLVIPSSAVDA